LLNLLVMLTITTNLGQQPLKSWATLQSRNDTTTNR
jgi:hypothetical protein